MCGEAVSQRMRMDFLADTRPLGGLLAGIPDGLGADGTIGGMRAPAGKQPVCRFALQPMPVLSQGFQQLRAEHNVAIFAAFPALDVDDHSPTVNIGDLQSGQLSAPHSGGIERHQQNAMKGIESQVNKLADFFRAQDDGETLHFLRIWRLGDAPRPSQRLDVEES